MTARGPPTLDDGAHKYCRRTWSFEAVAATRRLCENARQSQAASWRAASSFPLVNYLPVQPPCTSLSANSSIMLGSYSSIVSVLSHGKASSFGLRPSCRRHMLLVPRWWQQHY